MDHIRVLAYETVMRACGFGSLAIFCVMVGMSFDARAAFQAGGFLTTMMALILIYKAWEAPHQEPPPHRAVALPPQGSSARRKATRNGRSPPRCARPT